MRLTFSENVDEVIAALDDVDRKQVPIALVWALNDMAAEALKGLQADMDQHFDRPTNYTKRAFKVWKANKQTLTAEVGEKPDVTSRHYLKVQERGGERPLTLLEQNLRTRLPFGSQIVGVIPAEGAQLDAFGNWKSSERNRVMSQLKVGRDVGYDSNATEASTKRRIRRRGATYFTPRHGLAPGVYKRAKKGDTPVRILKFTQKAARYKPRLGFVEGATARVRKDFPAYFARGLARAFATAHGRARSHAA